MKNIIIRDILNVMASNLQNKYIIFNLKNNEELYKAGVLDNSYFISYPKNIRQELQEYYKDFMRIYKNAYVILALDVAEWSNIQSYVTEEDVIPVMLAISNIDKGGSRYAMLLESIVNIFPNVCLVEEIRAQSDVKSDMDQMKFCDLTSDEMVQYCIKNENNPYVNIYDKLGMMHQKLMRNEIDAVTFSDLHTKVLFTKICARYLSSMENNANKLFSAMRAFDLDEIELLKLKNYVKIDLIKTAQLSTNCVQMWKESLKVIRNSDIKVVHDACILMLRYPVSINVMITDNIFSRDELNDILYALQVVKSDDFKHGQSWREYCKKYELYNIKQDVIYHKIYQEAESLIKSVDLNLILIGNIGNNNKDVINSGEFTSSKDKKRSTEKIEEQQSKYIKSISHGIKLIPVDLSQKAIERNERFKKLSFAEKDKHLILEKMINNFMLQFEMQKLSNGSNFSLLWDLIDLMDDLCINLRDHVYPTDDVEKCFKEICVNGIFRKMCLSKNSKNFKRDIEDTLRKLDVSVADLEEALYVRHRDIDDDISVIRRKLDELKRDDTVHIKDNHNDETKSEFIQLNFNDDILKLNNQNDISITDIYDDTSHIQENEDEETKSDFTNHFVQPDFHDNGWYIGGEQEEETKSDFMNHFVQSNFRDNTLTNDQDNPEKDYYRYVAQAFKLHSDTLTEQGYSERAFIKFISELKNAKVTLRNGYEYLPEGTMLILKEMSKLYAIDFVKKLAVSDIYVSQKHMKVREFLQNCDMAQDELSGLVYEYLPDHVAAMNLINNFIVNGVDVEMVNARNIDSVRDSMHGFLNDMKMHGDVTLRFDDMQTFHRKKYRNEIPDDLRVMDGDDDYQEVFYPIQIKNAQDVTESKFEPEPAIKNPNVSPITTIEKQKDTCKIEDIPNLHTYVLSINNKNIESNNGRDVKCDMLIDLDKKILNNKVALQQLIAEMGSSDCMFDGVVLHRAIATNNVDIQLKSSFQKKYHDINAFKTALKCYLDTISPFVEYEPKVAEVVGLLTFNDDLDTVFM